MYNIFIKYTNININIILRLKNQIIFHYILKKVNNLKIININSTLKSHDINFVIL